MKNIKIITVVLFASCFSYAQEKLCFGEDAKAVISSSLLIDGTYELVYNLTGSNSVTDKAIEIVFSNGIGNVLVPADDFKNSGVTTLTVLGMKNKATECYATFPQLLSKSFIIKDYINLNLKSEYTFCKDKKKRLLDITDLTQWYNQEKEPLGSNEILQTGIYYYKDISDDGCLSVDYNAIQVTINPCELLIPSAFTPNGDNNNDTFNLVNIEDKYPNYEIIIANRHGKLLYKGKNGWKGTLNNEGSDILENGLYYMYLNYNDSSIDNTKHTILLQK